MLNHIGQLTLKEKYMNYISYTSNKDGYLVVRLFDEHNEWFCSICGYEAWVNNELFYEHNICLLKGGKK